MYQGKLWLLTMCQSNYPKINDLIKDIYPTFNGIVAVCHNDKTSEAFDILEKNKGEGKIIKRDFVFHHGHSMSETLLCRHIKNGEYVVWLDSSDRMTEVFLKIVRSVIFGMQSSDIDGIYADGRIWLWKYDDLQLIMGNPHWFLTPPPRQSISLNKEQKDAWFVNTRWENPSVSMCYNGCKYWFVYSNGNNQVLADYGKYGQEIVDFHEQTRQQFRIYCEQNLKLSLNSLDDLINYMIKIKNKETIPDEYFVDIVEKEYRLSELFQLKVLNQDFVNIIAKNRYKFSFLNYLKFGDGFIDKNYCGTILIYDKKFNIKN